MVRLRLAQELNAKSMVGLWLTRTTLIVDTASFDRRSVGQSKMNDRISTVLVRN